MKAQKRGGKPPVPSAIATLLGQEAFRFATDYSSVGGGVTGVGLSSPAQKSRHDAGGVSTLLALTPTRLTGGLR
jgi:hypothetical protein